ncbi:MAG TPA: isochorismatase family cysteine hydrolase [Steroidobacteraceae bacterium]|nr:isochorismatase family cysteine hydrolase [Steroidobacteraceae bacterium]
MAQRHGIARRPAGSAKGRAALLVIDLINDFSFPDGARVWREVQRVQANVGALLDKARRNAVPVVYVNDNLGRWRSDARRLVERCTAPSSPSRDFVQRIAPQERDYFVLKPRHSGFYCTPLELLLEFLRVRTLILTGISTNSCIWMTASEAHQREYRLIVPRDAVAATTARDSRMTLQQLQRSLAAHVCAAREVRLSRGRVL